MATRKNSRPQRAQASVQVKIETERRRLNKAVAVLVGAELTAEYCPERALVTDAVGVARELVETTIEALDSVKLNR